MICRYQNVEAMIRVKDALGDRSSVLFLVLLLFGWIVAHRPELFVQSGHSSLVGSVASSAEETSLHSEAQKKGSDAGSPKADQAQLVVQLGHAADVFSAAFSPDGRYVLTGGRDSALLWEAETGREIRRFEGHSPPPVSSVAFSPNGEYVLTGSWDKTVRLWETETGREVRGFTGHTGEIYATAFSPDGNHVLTGSHDKTARLWEAHTGREVLRFLGHSEGVWSVAFSPDGEYVLTGGLDDTARLWESKTGREVRRFVSPSLMVHPVAFSPDGKYVLTGGWDKTARLWETATGLEVRTFQHASAVQDACESRVQPAVSSVAFSPNGEFVLTGTLNSTTRLWELETGRVIRSFAGELGSVQSVAFSPDGKYILTSGHTARLWETATGREGRRFEGNAIRTSSVAVSHDGKYLLTAGSGRVRLWSLETGSELRRFGQDSAQVNCVVFSPDGRYAATGGLDKTVWLWDLETGKAVRSFDGHSHEVKYLTFSPDGQYILTGDWKTVRLWETKTGRQLRNYEGLYAIDSIAFSPDGKQVAASCRSDDTALVWERETGTVVQRLNGAASEVFTWKVSPDRRYVMIGVGNERGFVTPRLLEHSGREIRRWGSQSLSSAIFSPDGKLVITGGRDSTTRFWDTASGKELCSLVSFRDGTWVVVDPAGRFDTNNLEEIKGLHWIMPDDPMRALALEIFMRDYYEPRLLTRILNGEKFKEVRDISEVNRVQPRIEINTITIQKQDPSLVTVIVEVGKAKSELKQGQKRTTYETGVYDVRLFRDGQIVGQWPEPAMTSVARDTNGLDHWRQSTRVKLEANGRQTIRFENIRLPRKAEIKEIEFSAYAFNEDRVKSQTDKETFAVPQVLTPRSGRAYIVSVGVNSFESSDLDLQYAANDARVTQELLKRKLIETKQYGEVVQIPLISDAKDKHATKANFKAVLDLLSGKKVEPGLLKVIPAANQIKEAHPEDLVVISFSSHGYADDSGSFYLFPTDTGRRIKGRINEQRLISSEELSLWLKDVDAGEMVMIVDACHAAAAVEGSEFKPGPMGSRGLGQLSYDKGMRILTATQAANVAIEAGLIGHGLLTYALVKEGLEEHEADFKPKDQLIALKEWLEYGAERVPKLYAEILSGKVPGINRAVLVGSVSGRRGYQQQPSLFDFSRKDREVVLMRIPVSDSR